MRADSDRGKDGGPWNDVREHTEKRGPGKIDTDLFCGLPDGGRDEIRIGGLPPASGERDVPGPRIPFAVRAPDDEYRIGTGCEDERDRRPVEAWLIGYDRQGSPEAAGEESIGRQWECDRQDPPQQPPAAAGAGVEACDPAFDAVGRAVSDMRRSTASLPQGQVTATVPRTSRSNRLPQSLH